MVATGGYRSQPIRLRGEPLADPTLIPSAKPSLTAPMSRCWWACPSRIPGKTLCRESATEPPKEMDPNCWNASLSDSPHQIRKQEACLEFLFPGMVNGPADVLWKGDFFHSPPYALFLLESSSLIGPFDIIQRSPKGPFMDGRSIVGRSQLRPKNQLGHTPAHCGGSDWGTCRVRPRLYILLLGTESLQVSFHRPWGGRGGCLVRHPPGGWFWAWCLPTQGGMAAARQFCLSNPSTRAERPCPRPQ